MATKATLTDRPSAELSQILEDLSRFAQPDAPLKVGPEAGKDVLAALINDQSSNIDNNVKQPGAGPGFFERIGNWFSGNDAEEKPQIGAKEALKATIAKALNPEESIGGTDARGLEAALAAGGYASKIDGTLDPEEKASLPDLQAQLNNNVSISSIFAANAEKQYAAQRDAEVKSAAEAAAKLEQADINAQVSGSLVLAGYLKPENASNPKAVQSAADLYLVNNTKDLEEAVKLSKQMFPNGEEGDHTPSSESVVILGGMMRKRNPALGIESLLESGNPDDAKHVQGYLRLMGHNAVEVTGTFDAATQTAAQEEMRKPLQSLDGMSTAEIYSAATSGQMDFIKDHLTPGELAAMNALKPASERGAGEFTCQETFLANIAMNDRARFEKILAQENEKRADATIDRAVENKVVPIAPEMSNQEERDVVAQNPAAIAATTSIEKAPVADIGLDKGAVGVTDRNGLAVFENTDQGFQNIAAALKENSGWGDGVADGKITLAGAAGALHYGSTALDEGKPFMMVEPQPHDLAVVSEALGRQPGEKFDLENPRDMKDLMGGLSAYRAAKMDGVPITADAIADRMPLAGSDTAAAIDRASGVAPAAEPAKEPAQPEQSAPQISSYRDMFDKLARGEIEPAASEAEKRLQEVLDRRSGLAAAAPAVAI